MLLHLQGFYLHQENRLFFYNDFGVGCKKVFVVKAYISDDTKSVCYNAKFIGIAEMSVHIHLLNGRICGSMRRHGAIGCFVRVVGIIQSFCLFKCFELLYDTSGIEKQHGSFLAINFLAYRFGQFNHMIEHGL